jgi:glycerol-3-phosphate dehydrogenase
VGGDGSVGLQRHDRIRDHAEHGAGGLLSVAGAKYTTARAVAERVTDLAIARLGKSAGPCRTAVVPLPGGGLRDVPLAIAEARHLHDTGLPSDSIPHLVAAYGTRYDQVVLLAAERSEWRARVADGSPVIGAQLVWAFRHEMAVTLGDAVIRRTPLGALGLPGEATLQRAADIVGSHEHWSDERKRQEIDDVRRFYSPRAVIS